MAEKFRNRGNVVFRGGDDPKTAEIRFLTSTKQDLDFLDHLEKSAFPKAMRTSRQDWKELMEWPGCIILGITDDIGLFACLGAVPSDSEWELKEWDPELVLPKGAYYLESVATYPGYQRLGLFSILWKKLMAEMKKRGIPLLQLHARDISSAILQKMGYKPVRSVDNWHGTKETFDYFEIPVLANKRAESSPKGTLLNSDELRILQSGAKRLYNEKGKFVGWYWPGERTLYDEEMIMSEVKEREKRIPNITSKLPFTLRDGTKLGPRPE